MLDVGQAPLVWLELWSLTPSSADAERHRTRLFVPLTRTYLPGTVTRSQRRWVKLRTPQKQGANQGQRPVGGGHEYAMARPSITAPLGFGNATSKSLLCARSSMDKTIGFYPVSLGFESSQAGQARVVAGLAEAVHSHLTAMLTAMLKVALQQLTPTSWTSEPAPTIQIATQGQCFHDHPPPPRPASELVRPAPRPSRGDLRDGPPGATPRDPPQVPARSRGPSRAPMPRRGPRDEGPRILLEGGDGVPVQLRLNIDDAAEIAATLRTTGSDCTDECADQLRYGAGDHRRRRAPQWKGGDLLRRPGARENAEEYLLITGARESIVDKDPRYLLLGEELPFVNGATGRSSIGVQLPDPRPPRFWTMTPIGPVQATSAGAWNRGQRLYPIAGRWPSAHWISSTFAETSASVASGLQRISRHGEATALLTGEVSGDKLGVRRPEVGDRVGAVLADVDLPISGR